MQNSSNWPLGVCVFPEPDINRPHTIAYPNYIHEILKNAGLCYTTIAPGQLAQNLDSVRILLTVGERTLADDQRAKLTDWIKRGGAWSSIAGLRGMKDVLGADVPPGVAGWA